MPATSWRQNTTVLLIACLVLPPVGIILLWLRPGWGVFRKLALTVPVIALFVGHLFWFYGMHLELDGSGMRPIVSFYDPASRDERLAAPERRAETAIEPEHAAPAEQETGSEPAQQIPGQKMAVAEVETSSTPSLETAPIPAAGSVDSTKAARAYWIDYRGPHRDGNYEQTPILANWPSGGPRRVWRQSVGGGYASVTVANGRVFTIEQRRDQEVVAAYDFANGRELWTHSWAARFEEPMGGPGPRATPVWHEGKVYALGATGELNVLEERTGKVIWHKNILADNGAENLQWAMAASPLIVDDKVIVQPGGSNGRSVIAYNKLSGEPVWKSLSDRQSYTSPMEATLAGRRQIVTVSADRMMGLAVEDGSLLWDFPWKTSFDINAAQPLIVDAEHVFISAGYDHGAALLKITAAGGAFKAEPVWQNNTMKCRFNSPVLYEGIVYGLDEGILAAVDVRTGERKWKGGRYRFGQVLLADGHLIVVTELGDVALVKASPNGFQELATFKALDGKTWNNPAIAEGRLIVRNQTEMACYDILAPSGT